MSSTKRAPRRLSRTPYELASFLKLKLTFRHSLGSVSQIWKREVRSGGVQLGSIIFVIIYCTEGISGGYINSAVAFRLFLARKVLLIRVVLYMVAQCLGVMAGVGLVKAFQNSYYKRYNSGANKLNDGYNIGVGLRAEIISIGLISTRLLNEGVSFK